ncbi:MAG: GAF domain-containing protein [Azospirillaceae bacterium]|nr:GAF domain-containing protein [Azospirillaceae bacterium]
MTVALLALAAMQVALSGLDMRAAWMRADDARAAGAVAAVARTLLAAQDAQSAQWTAMVRALRHAAPADASAAEDLDQARQRADQALDRGLEALSALPAGSGYHTSVSDGGDWAAAVQRVVGARQELAGLRRAVDQALHQPVAGRDPPMLNNWLAGERALSVAEGRLIRQLTVAAGPAAMQAADALALRRDAETAWVAALAPAAADGAASGRAVAVHLFQDSGPTVPTSDELSIAAARFATALAGPDTVAGDQAGIAALAGISAVADGILRRWAEAPVPGPKWAALKAGGPLLLAAGLTLAILLALRRGVFDAVARTARLMRDLAEGQVTQAPTLAPRLGGDQAVAELHAALALYWSHARRIERETQRRERAERLLTVERKVLGMTAGRAPLSSVLAALCSGMEAELEGGLCSIMLVDADGGRIYTGAAPSLPQAYVRAIDGLVLTGERGSCGTAIVRREPVIVTDIAHDPLWAEFREVTAAAGLAACWSLPIMAGDGQPLGAFAVYFRTPRSPEGWMLDLARRASRLATVAISAERAADEVERAKGRRRTGQPHQNGVPGQHEP